ncbi:hypothetical protein PUNSTDRAFT_17327, partial [Punctularia strigosozonata HHB-11173 SS5]|uniref:uncharacterized protein n=1 Tax=Punctularia strigosozonata (strain HHB-11173) TaxID=741275 RepID=UPI0004416B11
PTFSMCCDHGKVRVPLARDPPAALRKLFEDTSKRGKEFHANIRQYNAALAFTSLGVKIDDTVNSGQGPYAFWIHGELYHRMGSLLPVQGHVPLYAQLYIHNPSAALTMRMQQNLNLSRDTMSLLQVVLAEHHPYSQVYKQAYEILAEQGDTEDVSIHLCVNKSRDRRQYNLLTVDKVAVVLPGDRSHLTDSHDIIICKGSGPLQRISDGHPAYACLHYVLLFP